MTIEVVGVSFCNAQEQLALRDCAGMSGNWRFSAGCGGAMTKRARNFIWHEMG